jgi:hypothetical protein
MYLGSMAPSLDWLEHTHPTIAAILEFLTFGFMGFAVFYAERKKLRVRQFSVYRRLLKRIQDKKALCPTVSRKR